MAKERGLPMIIFDDGLGKLGPMADLRAAFEVRTGVCTTAHRLATLRSKSLAGYWVPGRLEASVRLRANAPVNELPKDEEVLCVNGRWSTIDGEARLPLGEALLEGPTGHVIAAHLRRADAEYLLTTGQLHERVRTRSTDQRELYRYPWDVIGAFKQTIPADLHMARLLESAIMDPSGWVVGSESVEVHRTATVWPGVVFDATKGPIRVDKDATVRPGAVLCGPCAVLRGATVLDRALIKANTVIGPMCKAAGEIGGTVFQGYANKGHDGHLGDSWVGKWANLGAGTTNSNLLNTYGEVTMRVEPDGPRHRTGLTFLGTIIGDHVKTAIETRLMTGTVLGTGSMIACTPAPPATVRRFAWITDDGERTYQLEKFIETMRTVMARRGKEPSEAYLELVKGLHEGAKV